MQLCLEQIRYCRTKEKEMKIAIKVNDIDHLQSVMEDAMLRALKSLGEDACELSLFCTDEEAVIDSEARVAA